MSNHHKACLLHYRSSTIEHFSEALRDSTQRSLTPTKTKSAVDILKEENQTPKREINLSLPEAINSIQMWQRMKPPAMCLKET